MATRNTASAHWTGDLKSGKGQISGGSGALARCPTTSASGLRVKGHQPRRTDRGGHAACFSMALSGELGKANLTAEAIDTTATVTLDFIDGTPTITKAHLDLTAKISGATEAVFMEAANSAKANCPDLPPAEGRDHDGRETRLISPAEGCSRGR